MHKDIEVLILCGGEGKRLRSLVPEVPKPMAPIRGRPFLDFLVHSLENQGFRNFCFLVGYKSEIIKHHFSKPMEGNSYRFSVEEYPLGTGGAIFRALRSSHFSKFIVLNGDTYFNIDLTVFLKGWQKGTFKIALKYVLDTARYGRVISRGDGLVTQFVEKGSNATGSGFINGGVYAIHKSLLDYSSGDTFISIEQDIFPKLLIDQKIYAQPFSSEFIDIGIPEDYIRAQKLIPEWSQRQF